MKSIELKKLRGKQITVTNSLILALLILFFVMVRVFGVTFSVFFFVLGVLILIQAVLGLIKGNSTKSFIPVFEQVANYEKQKMGREWNKQRKMSYIWNLILSGFMFLQYYLNHDSTDYVFQIDFILMLIITLITIGLVNISLLLHFRKVDDAISESDFKGYTWKSNLLAVVVGIAFAFVMIAIIILYILTTIPEI
ncbi:hypothetical protein ACW2QC_14340 [Virgibacillus sp. FSP13]